MSGARERNSTAFKPEEFAEERRRFIRDADDLVRCLTIEFEIEPGSGVAVIPVGEMFEFAPPQRPLRERGASDGRLTEGYGTRTPRKPASAMAFCTVPSDRIRFTNSSTVGSADGGPLAHSDRHLHDVETSGQHACAGQRIGDTVGEVQVLAVNVGLSCRQRLARRFEPAWHRDDLGILDETLQHVWGALPCATAIFTPARSTSSALAGAAPGRAT